MSLFLTTFKTKMCLWSNLALGSRGNNVTLSCFGCAFNTLPPPSSSELNFQEETPPWEWGEVCHHPDFYILALLPSGEGHSWNPCFPSYRLAEYREAVTILIMICAWLRTGDGVTFWAFHTHKAGTGSSCVSSSLLEIFVRSMFL